MDNRDRLVDNFYQGYWQRKGWANNAKYNTHSFIVIPGNAAGKKKIQWSSIIIRFCFGRIGSVILVHRFPGDRGILKVEVSTDGGKSWTPTQLKEPLSQYTWVLWATKLDLKGSRSNYNISVRAY